MKQYFTFIILLTFFSSTIMSMWSDDEEPCNPLLVYDTYPKDIAPIPSPIESAQSGALDLLPNLEEANSTDFTLGLPPFPLETAPTEVVAAWSVLQEYVQTQQVQQLPSPQQSLSPLASFAATDEVTAGSSEASWNPQEEDAEKEEEEDDDCLTAQERRKIHRKERKEKRNPQRKERSHRKRDHIKIPAEELALFKQLKGKSATELWSLHQKTPLFGKVEKNGRILEGLLPPCFEKNCPVKHNAYARSFASTICSHLAAIREGAIPRTICAHCKSRRNAEPTALFFHWALSCKALAKERERIFQLSEKQKASAEEDGSEYQESDSGLSFNDNA